MSGLKHGGPAFPVVDPMIFRPGKDETAMRLAAGMSLRDYFAAKAIQGLLASNAMYGGRTDNHAALAADAYATADAMLEARNK